MEDIFRPERIRDTLERMIDNLPGFVYRCRNDQYWTMMFISEQSEKITGYKPEELIGNKVVSYDDVILEPYRKYLHERWKEVIAKKEVLAEEYKIRRKDGSVRWVWEQGRGVFNTVTGKLLYLDGYVVDITDRIDAVENLLESNRKLVEANKKREEALKLKSLFLSNLSHEIRTPVNAIMGFTEILSQEGLSAADKQDCVEIIHKSNKALLGLVEDIVQASKIETNQLKPHLSKVTAGELCHEVSASALDKARLSGKDNFVVTGVQNICCKDVVMFTDRDFVIDAVIRLLDNAFRFTEEGIVQLDISIDKECSRLIFDISDQGKGLSEEAEANIFNSFYRADVPVNTRTRGAGLGLYISRACSRLLGGDLYFLGNTGQGARFRIVIPVIPLK